MRIGRTLFVGQSLRTNAEGIRQLRAFAEPLGTAVVEVGVTSVLHLKTAATALPDGSVFAYLPALDDPSPFPRLVEAPEAAGANVLPLGGDRLLVPADAPRSAEVLAGLGYEPVAVDIGELAKLEGGVTCLSVVLTGR